MTPLTSEVSKTSRHFWGLYLKATGFCPLARAPPFPPQLLQTLRTPYYLAKYVQLQQRKVPVSEERKGEDFSGLASEPTSVTPHSRLPQSTDSFIFLFSTQFLPHKMAPLQTISTSVAVALSRWQRARGTSDKASLPWAICLNPSLCGCTALSLFVIQYRTPVDDWQGQTWNNISSRGQWPAIINSFPNSLLPVVDYWQWLCFIARRKMSLLLPVSKTALRVFSTPEKRAFHETGS